MIESYLTVLSCSSAEHLPCAICRVFVLFFSVRPHPSYVFISGRFCRSSRATHVKDFFIPEHAHVFIFPYVHADALSAVSVCEKHPQEMLIRPCFPMRAPKRHALYIFVFTSCYPISPPQRPPLPFPGRALLPSSYTAPMFDVLAQLLALMYCRAISRILSDRHGDGFGRRGSRGETQVFRGTRYTGALWVCA